MIVKDWIDKQGIKRRSAVPSEYDKPDEGIPLDIYNELDILYEDTPLSFRVAFYDKLWQRGLIERKDFFARDAVDRFRQALLNALALDANLTVQYVRDLEQKAIPNGTGIK